MFSCFLLFFLLIFTFSPGVASIYLLAFRPDFLVSGGATSRRLFPPTSTSTQQPSLLVSCSLLPRLDQLPLPVTRLSEGKKKKKKSNINVKTSGKDVTFLSTLKTVSCKCLIGEQSKSCCSF